MISFNKKYRESASFQGITELKEAEIIKIKDKETNNNDEEREEISDEEKQIIIKNDYEEHIYKNQ